MKIAHTLRYGPHKSGLYETTREIAAAEIAAGHDSRMVDPTANLTYVDRGVQFAPRTWMEQADILVNHGGIGRGPEGLPPIVLMLHGTPHYCFAIEHYHGIPVWRKVAEAVALDCVGAFVTWQQNIAGWSLIVPPEQLYAVRPCVDLNFWTPAGEAWDYHGRHTNIVITDRWRPTKDSFGLLAGFARYADDHPEARLHLYGAPEPCMGPLASILNGFRARGILGEVRGDVTAEDLRAIYRAADVVLTSDGGTARTIREAMACGCQVVSGRGANCETWEVDTDNPEETAATIGCAMVTDRGREYAEELFNPANTVADLQAVYERVLKGRVT